MKSKMIADGKAREVFLKPILEQAFKIPLQHSKYIFSHFDFYSEHYLFELKSYSYSYEKYHYEIIGTNKALNDHTIFIFEHEKKDIYFIQYNEQLFNTFSKRDMKFTTSIISTEVFDIPKKYLTKLENFTEFNFSKNADSLFFIDQDRRNALAKV